MRDRSVVAFAFALAAMFPLTILIVIAACIPIAQPAPVTKPQAGAIRHQTKPSAGPRVVAPFALDVWQR